MDVVRKSIRVRNHYFGFKLLILQSSLQDGADEMIFPQQLIRLRSAQLLDNTILA